MSELSTIVHHGLWAHFLEVHRRLKVSIELVDEHFAPQLRSLGERSLSEGCRALDRIEGRLQDAIRRVLLSRDPEVVVVDETPIVCAPVARASGSAAGAVLVAFSGNHQPNRNAVSKLGRIAVWLAGAVSKQLGDASRVDTSELDRFSSLYRLLKQAARHGSEREVV